MTEMIYKFSKILPDKLYIRLMYYKHFRKFPDLKTPKTFNEKLQWLKLYDRNPEYTKMVDKITVKHYVESLIGDRYVIPTLNVWDSVENIDLNQLPDQFVLKCNHDSKSVAICKNKSTFDFNGAKALLKKRLRQNGFWYGREWPYKKIIPKLMAEKYIQDSSGENLRDYKVLCFNGKAKLIEVHSDRFTDLHRQDIYDVEWNKTAITQGPHSNEIIEKPDCLNEMIEMSEKLANGIRHIRVDWYCANGKLLFGELTFFDGSGFVGFDNPEHDNLLGSWIQF